MKIIIRAEDIKRHQALRNKLVSVSRKMTLSGKYIILFFKSELMKELIMPLIEKKVPYLLVNHPPNSQPYSRSSSQMNKNI